MKRLIPIILILIAACDNRPVTDRITGDLFFSLFRVGNYCNKPDSVIKRYETYFDTLKYETADENEKKFLIRYKELKEENLLYKPFVDILIEKDSMVTLYLEKGDYEKISKYKREKLQDEHKKIKIEADVFKIDDGLYFCVELLEVKIVDGETFIKSKKFKIEDYE